ncbi:MAG TPA: ABC transporter substrate-binding protein [Acidimicrobiia bacterium]|jgi:polar amino acid transport system substrate-binding protein|nr:ABC transporter substrate-binding protein [Acidimicrobiia bacterium]
MTDDRTPDPGAGAPEDAGAAAGTGGSNTGWIIGGVVAVIAIIAIIWAVAAGGDDEDDEVTAGDTTTTVEETTTTAEDTTTTAAETTTTVAETTTTVGDVCAIDSLALVNAGTLTVATGEPAFPPWVGTTAGENFDSPESGTGYEAALVYEIASRMGFSADQVTWVRTGFDEAIAPGPKNFDFNVQQYSITDEREQVVDFSVPYYVTQQALVTFEDSDFAGVTTLAELAGARLGAQIGTTSLDFIDNVIQPDEAAFVYNTNADAKAALDANQIDGIVVDLPTAYFITAVEIEGSIVAGTFAAQADMPDEFGLLFSQDNTLRECVDPVLTEMTNDGTITSLIDQWLEAGGDVPEIGG